jgi:hypothetical protein
MQLSRSDVVLMREPHCTKSILHWHHDRIAKTAICKERTSRHRPNEATKIAPFRRNQTKYPRRSYLLGAMMPPVIT